MMRSVTFIFRTAAPFLWAAFIFYLSSIPNLAISSGWSDAWFRVVAHAGEYAVLTVLIFQAMQMHLFQLTRSQLCSLSVVCAIIYAFSDEWHQSFVPTRQASVSDLFVDTGGSILGVLLWIRFYDYHKTA